MIKKNRIKFYLLLQNSKKITKKETQRFIQELGNDDGHS